MNGIMTGAAAGAVGTVALNATTYLDMLLRGRPESKVPAKVAGKMAEEAGVDLAPEAEQQKEAEQKSQSRRSAIGALMGYVTGLGVGAVYGALRGRVRPPLPLAGVGLGFAAMATSDVPSIALGATDPREWGLSGWAADIVPHLAYGFATAAAFEAFTNGTGR